MNPHDLKARNADFFVFHRRRSLRPKTTHAGDMDDDALFRVSTDIRGRPFRLEASAVDNIVSAIGRKDLREMKTMKPNCARS